MKAKRVYAHRGGALLWPENTVEAFRNAHARFPDVWIELDVRRTADDVLVVIHDPTLDRTTDRTGTVAELPADECPVPRLRDVLEEGAASGWRLVMELKGGPQDARDAIGLLRDAGYPRDRCILLSFHAAVLDAVDGAYPTGFLTSWADEAFALATIEYSVKAGCSLIGVGCDGRPPGAALVRHAQERGLHVAPWTINDEVLIDGCVADGVDGIITDRPDLLYA